MSTHIPAVSVVLPAFGRPDLLERALTSVAAQTLGDFECIVVDDGSPQPVEAVVRGFDERFVYLRHERNAGVVAARRTGYARASAPIVAKLDSDDELLPHALERAVSVLDEHRDVGAAIGLADYEGRLPLRVHDGLHVVDPEEYVRRAPPPLDVVDVFRAPVVREWLEELPVFFKEEFAFKLTLGLRHPVLYVDEPWGIHHTDASERLSRAFDDPRWLDDVRRFVGHFRPLIGTTPCAPLDQHLTHRRYLLTRLGHREEARLVSGWLAERGVGPLRQARILLRTRYRDRRNYVV